jgi:hypothetical protein
MAIDPGTTNGVAIYKPGYKVWEWEEIQGHVHFWKLLTSTDPDLVILERFQFQARQKAVLDPVEYVGITKLYCSATSTKLVLQTAAQAKGLWPDEKLKRIELFDRIGPLKHARDATRHMLYYLTASERNMEFADRLRVK